MSMKEYLNKTTGEYRKTAENVTGEQWVEIPSPECDCAVLDSVSGVVFNSAKGGIHYLKSLPTFLCVVWQRHTPPEAPPFIDDEPSCITEEDFVFTPSSQSRTASEIADASLVHIKERATTYDQADGERSAQKTAVAFNAITGHNVSEAEVFLLLQILKDVRQWSRDEYHQDSAEDCIAYASLKAEALEKELQNK